jgi:hypothetical protein
MGAKKAREFSFKPKQLTKQLLKCLPERAREVLIARYGLGKNTDRMTLEAIGAIYGITRERVRQIENYALTNIRKSKEYELSVKEFAELEKVITELGGIVVESDLLEEFAKDKSTQNHFHFLLVAGHRFSRHKEDDHFQHRWFIDKTHAEKIHGALHKLYESLTDEDLVAESDMITNFLEHLKEVAEQYKQEEIIKRWLKISKRMDKNPLGEWGVAHSPNIKAKGMRDYAFLVIRKHGSPIHFKEVARQIEKIFNKKAHVATTHNELIKDSRFVLVGRGLYALKEWGYASGVVKDVIREVLEKNGPLSRQEVIEKVLKERYVKENTILVNLQNPKFFRKDKDGKYHPAEGVALAK